MAVWHTSLGKDTRELVGVTADADDFLMRHDVPPAPRFKAQLAMEELLRNLLDHTSDSPDLRIDLRLEVQPDRVVIVLEDDGPPFDLRQAPAFDKNAPLAERTGRGMGIHLVRHFVKEIDYERQDGRNRVSLVVTYDAEHVA